MGHTLTDKRNSYSKINAEYETFKRSYDEKTEEMRRTSELIQTLTTGISAQEGHENGYMEQLQGSDLCEIHTWFTECRST